MSQTEIYQILKDTLVNLFEIDADKIHPDAKLFDDLEIDSIDAIDLIDQVKRQTGYKLLAEDFRNVRTIQDVVDAIAKKDLS